MSKGKSHDRFNLLIGAVLMGFWLGIGIQWKIVLSFMLGWLMATFIFSPDTDLLPKNKAKVLRIFLYPYSVFFRHRGLSHSLVFGTLTRVFYVIGCLGIMIFIFHQMGYLSLTVGGYGALLWGFITDFNYALVPYKIVVWFYFGMFLADCIHVFLDKIASLVKKLLRFI